MLLAPEWMDMRTAMPATALLTIVFLQQTSQAAIPELATLVLMDKIYVLAYAVVILTFVRILWDDVKVHEHDTERVPAIRKGDRLLFVVLTTGFAVVPALLILSALR